MQSFATLTHYAGFDWAKAEHQVVIIEAGGQVVAEFRFEHTAAGWQLCRNRLRRFPALGVAIETSQGAAVEKLLESGVTVYPVNPKRAQGYRQRYRPSGDKSDRVDARSLADALRLDGAQWKALAPEDPLVQQPRHRMSGRSRVDRPTHRPDQSVATSPARILPDSAGRV